VIGSLHSILAQSADVELRRRANAWRAGRPALRPRSRTPLTGAVPAELFEGPGVTIRYAYPDDDAALTRLAQLDEGSVPAGRVLLAEVADELWAAASVDGLAAIADPFRPSGPLVGMLLAVGRASAA
jgi:hypothetical protein